MKDLDVVEFRPSTNAECFHGLFIGSGHWNVCHWCERSFRNVSQCSLSNIKYIGQRQKVEKRINV